MNKTNWYPPHIKPVRMGLYEVGREDMWVLAYWCGKYWWASLNRQFKWNNQHLSWRGLTHEPH
jgi:hypothetical protein